MLEWYRRGPVESGLRLQTAVRLRWFGVVGQLVTVCFVRFVLDFSLPLGVCLAFIALSAWLNVFLRIRHPARRWLSTGSATTLLAYDILQLGALLYLTGGIENPFAFLLVVPVTVSAATLPSPHTIGLGLLAACVGVALSVWHLSLPWYGNAGLGLDVLYKVGMLASISSGMLFLALYAWRLAKEARQMTAALAATEMVLAREQQLHALDGLAAAAAHELGTPLSTITVVAKDLAREAPAGSNYAEDLALLQSQAQRCREILTKLTRSPGEPDPLHARMSLTQLVEEAAEPYRGFSAELVLSVDRGKEMDGQEPVGERRPGVIYGLGNLIENAVDFARRRVEVTARWSAREVTITIIDDGPGISRDIIDALGDPYITTRRSHRPGSGMGNEPSGLGLGFFIAKTLLERSGAVVSFENRARPALGAEVKIVWPRHVFEGRPSMDHGAELQQPFSGRELAASPDG